MGFLQARFRVTVLAIVLCVASLININHAVAQSDTSTETQAAASETTTPRDELQALRDILDNPEAVEGLKQQLDQVLSDQDESANGTTPSGDAETTERDAEVPRLSFNWQQALPTAERLTDQVEAYVWDRIDTFEQTLVRIANTVDDLPEVVDWMTTSLDERQEWQGFGAVAVRLLGALLVGLIVLRGIGRLLRPLDRRLASFEETGLLWKLLRAIPLTIIRAVPILLFAVAINIVILLISPDFRLRWALATSVTAIISVQVMMLVVRTTFAPTSPNARLVPIRDGPAKEVTRMFSIVLRLAVYGSTLILVLGLYGMPSGLGLTLQTVLAIMVLIFLITIIIGNRQRVADAIARLAGDDEHAHWSEIPWRQISKIWHVLAILFVLALFIIYVVQGQVFFLQVLGTVLLSFMVLVGLVWFLQYLEHNEDRLGGALEELDDDDEEPQEASKADRSQSGRDSPVLIALRLAVGVAAALTFLEVWGLNSWGWLFSGETALSRAMMRSIIAITVIYLLWLAISKVIASYIRRLQERAGSERSTNRTQTILVLARNGILVTLVVIGVLSILPNLGIDIAPLLAGAGVLGVAIGFGSQRLVQDIISGLFNLIEDNFAVGDVVDLGGKSGVVEAVTIRTVRLRDLGGNVHTIPFSAIDVVTNMTKEFSYAVFVIGVAYRENVDSVMRAIEEVGQTLRRERAYRRAILEPLEMFGLDTFGDSSINIKCRIKVRPGSQWMITREFNRRLKQRFDDLGIEIPFPHQTVYFGVDRDGSAPPAHISLEGKTDTASKEVVSDKATVAT